MKKIVYCIIWLTIFLSSCTKNRLDVDVSDIKVNLEIKRLDVDLFSSQSDEVISNLPTLMKNYGRFFEIYTTKIINLGGVGNRMMPDELKKYITYSTTVETAKKCKEKFSSIDDLKKELTDGFRHYKYYYPKATIPAIYTCVSSFNYSVITDDNTIGIGLDMYLGQDCEFYKNIEGFFNYMNYRVNPKRIALDALESYATMNFVYNDSIDNMVCGMIYQGRSKYFVKAMFPDTPDSLIVGYSPVQQKWCEDRHKEMWNYLIDQKLLFSTDRLDITKVITDAPYTKYFSKDSPGRVGVWLGFQIVKSYMENNPKVTLQDLMKERDYQKILNNAHYKPK